MPELSQTIPIRRPAVPQLAQNRDEFLNTQLYFPSGPRHHARTLVRHHGSAAEAIRRMTDYPTTSQGRGWPYLAQHPDYQLVLELLGRTGVRSVA